MYNVQTKRFGSRLFIIKGDDSVGPFASFEGGAGAGREQKNTTPKIISRKTPPATEIDTMDSSFKRP
jgi:hypothetical protein